MTSRLDWYSMAVMTSDLESDETAKLRRLILGPKRLERDDLGWHTPPIPPRLLPFGRSLKLSGDWKWRVLECSSGVQAFVLFGRVNMRKGNYQAWLLHKTGADIRLLARLEDHANHLGLHMHAHCGGVLPEPGALSIDAPVKRPNGICRRRAQGDTLDMFWTKACGMFNIGVHPPPIEPQLELPV